MILIPKCGILILVFMAREWVDFNKEFSIKKIYFSSRKNIEIFFIKYRKNIELI